MKVDCKMIEKKIFQYLRGKNHEWILPTITPRHWWECDIFSLTRAQYMLEFEIKVSVSDFKADFKKSIDGHRASMRRGISSDDRLSRDSTKEEKDAFRKKWYSPILKHDLLSQCDEQGPAYFWFATPEGLITPDMIPEYAGLMEVREPDLYGYCGINLVKEAPKLHKKKFGDDRLKAINDRMHWRYMNLYFDA